MSVHVCAIWVLWLKTHWKMRYLTERQRDVVIQLSQAGVSASRVAAKVNCNRRTVLRIRRRYTETGTWARLPGSARPRKTTPREDRYLGRLVTNRVFHHLSHLTVAFNQRISQEVSAKTVRRRLHAQRTFSRVAARKPLIRVENRRRRVAWCTRTIPWTLDQNWGGYSSRMRVGSTSLTMTGG